MPEEKYAREWARRLRARVLSGLYVDLNRDYRNTIFLAGSGRSGTTWLSDIINYKNEYRYVFEPFHPEKVEICRHFRHKQYLRPDDRREAFLYPAQTILSGALRNRWADRFHSRFVSERRLIKDIRANLMLGWIRANFPEMLMVFLLRHPCAVANSKVKLGWKPDVNDFLSQKALVEDFLWPFEDEMRSAKTDFERHVFSWCVENYVPLVQLNYGEAHLAFYENLAENPKSELGRMFAFMGKDFDESIFERMKKPSLLSRERSAVLSGERLADSWRNQVMAAQLERTIDILRLFGLDAVYSEKTMPDTDGAFSLMGAGR
ncbi:MAG: sulfotransferase [Rubrobacter sp.]|nr:sulfotransferase [Rubrobacter sp.]